MISSLDINVIITVQNVILIWYENIAEKNERETKIERERQTDRQTNRETEICRLQIPIPAIKVSTQYLMLSLRVKYLPQSRNVTMSPVTS